MGHIQMQSVFLDAIAYWIACLTNDREVGLELRPRDR